MSQPIVPAKTCARAFDTVTDADRAIRQLRAAGFSEAQLAVVCPPQFKDHFTTISSHSGSPTANAPEAIAKGGVLGATLGGLALVATVATGGAAGFAAAGLLIAGGAIAGGFSNLIVAKGYETEADDEYAKAVKRGKIVVGVEVSEDEAPAQLEKAQRLLEEAGGHEAQHRAS